MIRLSAWQRIGSRARARLWRVPRRVDDVPETRERSRLAGLFRWNDGAFEVVIAEGDVKLTQAGSFSSSSRGCATRLGTYSIFLQIGQIRTAAEFVHPTGKLFVWSKSTRCAWVT